MLATIKLLEPDSYASNADFEKYRLHEIFAQRLLLVPIQNTSPIVLFITKFLTILRRSDFLWNILFSKELLSLFSRSPRSVLEEGFKKILFFIDRDLIFFLSAIAGAFETS